MATDKMQMRKEGGIERNYLDHPRFGVGIVDPIPRLGGRAHACAFAVHGSILSAPLAASGMRSVALPLSA